MMAPYLLLAVLGLLAPREAESILVPELAECGSPSDRGEHSVSAWHAASDGGRTVQAYRLRTDEEFVFDGRLDEPFWQRAEPATAFTQQVPVEGGAPSQRTEVRIAHDGLYLILGAVLFDDQPDRIIAYNRRRDAAATTDDRFMFIIDTFGDGRNAYYFEVNPAGLRGDGILSTGQGSGLNRSWDGIWDARVARGEYGWSVEVRIPFRTLNFDPDRTTWGINFQRTIRRNHEEVLWSGHRRNQGLFRPQDAGRLTGMQNLSQGIGLEVTPYVVASSNRITGIDSRSEGDAGVDVSYSLTPNLRAALTINTDFAETQVDDRIVNLTRFPIFFPERRDFFLEGAHIFEFAPASGIQPYFSRRIGLVEGTPVPVNAGARITGQVGRTDVGLLQIRTGTGTIGPDESIGGEDFTVARARQHFMGESTIGLIYTRRATRGATDYVLNDRHTIGSDLELQTSRFLGDRNLQFQAFFVIHNEATPGLRTNWLNHSARGIRLSFPNEPWSGHVSYREFGEAFEPAVGFTPRRGFRRVQPSINYSPLLERSPIVRRLRWSLYLEYLTDLDFRPETVHARLGALDVVFETGDEFEIDIYRTFEHLTFDFDIRRDGTIIVPMGRYTGWGIDVEAQSTGRRPISGAVGVTREQFWSGHRTVWQGGLTYRSQLGLRFSGSYTLNDVDLQQGAFRASLLRLATDIDPTPYVAMTANVQYDDLSGLVGLFGRLRWTIRPGSDLYLIYTHNWTTYEARWTTLENGGAAKVTYTHWL